MENTIQYELLNNSNKIIKFNNIDNNYFVTDKLYGFNLIRIHILNPDIIDSIFDEIVIKTNGNIIKAKDYYNKEQGANNICDISSEIDTDNIIELKKDSNIEIDMPINTKCLITLFTNDSRKQSYKDTLQYKYIF